jgi:Cu/Ag efflux protein CusF
MKAIPRIRAVAAAFFVLIAAGCESSPPGEPTTAAAATEYMAVGTLNSVNATAGTVNISHNPVPAAGWPAMTMDFKVAEPGAVANLKPGDRVDIHFTIESGMNATITYIAPIE